MHPAIIIGTVRSLIVDVAMGQIPRSTERISSYYYYYLLYPQVVEIPGEGVKSKVNKMLSYRRDHAAGCVIVFAKSRRLELGDNILRTL